MNRLLPELDRLYGLRTSATGADATGISTGHSQHGIRAAVLAVVLPAGWEQLSSVWRGVQSDLVLPAPAIAVSGHDALQLWFSFESPISPSAAAHFLDGLRARYLPGVGQSQVRLFAEPAEVPVMPGVEVSSQRWSAFVTHDLASVFADTPWLDVPPGDEGQAAILRTLQPIGQLAFEAALTMLGAIENTVPLDAVASEQPDSPAAQSAEQQDCDPARFLAGVMNDETAPLALRIEAARILLPFGKRSFAKPS